MGMRCEIVCVCLCVKERERVKRLNAYCILEAQSGHASFETHTIVVDTLSARIAGVDVDCRSLNCVPGQTETPKRVIHKLN